MTCSFALIILVGMSGHVASDLLLFGCFDLTLTFRCRHHLLRVGVCLKLSIACFLCIEQKLSILQVADDTIKLVHQGH